LTRLAKVKNAHHRFLKQESNLGLQEAFSQTKNPGCPPKLFDSYNIFSGKSTD